MDTTLAILAGGQGQRMGRPKGELRIGDRPILEYLLEQFAWQGPTLLVTAPGRQHPPGWEGFDREVVDPVPDQGPLRGILTALQHLQTPKLIVATVDMPGVTRMHLDWLEQSLPSDKSNVLLQRGGGDTKQIEPFPSIFRGSAMQVIESQLKNESRSVKQLGQLDGFQCVDAPPSWDGSVWINLNRPSDLAEWMNRPQMNTDEHR
jgi:molybdopterin-guanine dinucleotide biosynthesis protein A